MINCHLLGNQLHLSHLSREDNTAFTLLLGWWWNEVKGQFRICVPCKAICMKASPVENVCSNKWILPNPSVAVTSFRTDKSWMKEMWRDSSFVLMSDVCVRSHAQSCFFLVDCCDVSCGEMCDAWCPPSQKCVWLTGHCLHKRTQYPVNECKGL